MLPFIIVLIFTELWFQHMFHHVWNLQVCIVQMGSDLLVFQLSLGNVSNFWCEMQRVWILLHLLTPQLLHTKLEQLLTRLKIGRCRSLNTLTHATFSLQWQYRQVEFLDQIKDYGVPERVGASIEAGVWRSQLLCIPRSETLSCRPTWQCSFCVGSN